MYYLCCHTAKAQDTLETSKMNVNPGGKQKVMRDTVWAGKVQKMNYALGISKGMRVVLEERGVRTQTLNADQMRTILSQREDSKNEKSLVEHFLESRGHTAIFLPKFHPELNPIERVWAQSKRYTKAYCKTCNLSERTIPSAFKACYLRTLQIIIAKCATTCYRTSKGMLPVLNWKKTEENTKKQ